MNIVAENIYKRYIAKYIIRDFSCTFQSGRSYGISGPNGSGKSTLIQMLSGYLSSSKGQIKYSLLNGDSIIRNEIFQYLALVAPYAELDLELTPREIFAHLKHFKKYAVETIEDLLKISNLKGNEDKQLKHFSSGMNQRFELVLATLSDAQLLLLDEPTSFLDSDSKIWWAKLLKDYATNKTIIIASNDQYDLDQTEKTIFLS